MRVFSVGKKERGQATLPDILVATFLFLLVLGGLLSYSNSLRQDAEDTLDRRALDVSAANAAEYVIKNPGVPTDWENESDINGVTQFGLARSDRVLRVEKIVAFVNYGNLDYEESKTRLNLGGHEFYATFEGGGLSLATGQAPPATASISTVERLVTVNNLEVVFTLRVYDD